MEKKLKLTLFERIYLPDVLPAKGSFTEAIIITDIKSKVAITQEEVKKYNVQSIDTRITWEGNPEVEFTFSELESKLIKESFQRLDAEKQLPTSLRHIELYKKFIE